MRQRQKDKTREHKEDLSPRTLHLVLSPDALVSGREPMLIALPAL